MANLSLRIPNEERELIEAYAKLQGMTVSEVLRKAVMEKIEDEYDLAIYEKEYAKYVNDGKKSRPFKEVADEL